MGSQKSEILHFDGLLLSKSYKVSAKKVQKLSLRTLKSDAKFKKKLTCGFKYDMKISSENFFSMGSFCLKYTRFELQKYSKNTEELSFMTLNSDANFE